MIGRIEGMCRDPSVAVLGLEDGLVPESDNFMLGMVRKDARPQTTWGGRETGADTLSASRIHAFFWKGNAHAWTGVLINFFAWL